MFLLDTNVVSELMRAPPDSNVRAWISRFPVDTLFFSAVGEAELRFGLALMPPGRRRERLGAEIDSMLREDFAGRVLPFDSSAARSYAKIAAARRSAGRPVPPTDGQIAAIAHSRGMAVATRNVRDFEQMQIQVINPWESVQHL